MYQPAHTYGPTCHLARSVTFLGSKGGDDMPDMRAQFFYSSQLPIDDPLSTAPTPTGSDSKSVKHLPRPFSAYDNNALEESWLGLGSEKDRRNHNKGKLRKASCPSHNEPGSTAGTLALVAKQKRKSSAGEGAMSRSGPIAPGTSDHEAKVVNSEVAKKLPADCEARRQAEALGNPYNPICNDPHHISSNSKIPVCWSDLEETSDAESKPHHGRAEASHENTRGTGEQGVTAASKKHKSGRDNPKGKHAKSASASRELDDSQGDATDETFFANMSRSLKEQDSSKSPAEEPGNCELSNEERVALEEYENSKGHQAFEKHLQIKHPGIQDSELTSREHKSSKKNAAPSSSGQASDLINRPDQGNDAGTTGRPFLKLPSRPTSPQTPLSDMPSHDGENQDPLDDQCTDSANGSRRLDERDSTETETLLNHKCKAHKNTKEHADVPVGVSRLHKVSLPALQMKPIYWSPVHDVAPVIRGTWFYKDTMYPVEPPVANQLETGYRELRPWSQTWKDELNSAIEVGAVGEEKIAYLLWPKDEGKYITSDDILSADPYCAARCFQGEAAAEGVADFDDPDKNSSDTKTIVKKYPNAQVIYRDSHNAYILKPNLHPSAYHKRRPLQKIKKGLTVGIHVVRGFDWKAWEKLHPSKKMNIATKAEEHAAVSGDSALGKRNACVACRSQEERKEVTDLVLVVHGIGQKLSERVESFHFTHAINAFRRSVNIELCNEAVQKVLRDDLGGVMVLPVNWRSNLSFEDGDPMKEGENDHSGSDFSLKDITPATIPAVRNLISDVMLDIPYYMSNNKARMIQAVISEANRVYRLWCKNNPEFYKNGRVHIIAHSLGSAMAVEILSKQPTLVPKIDFNGRKINTKHFEFNTTNLFVVGSPAGFFLLLEKGKLVPRKGQSKPGAEFGDDKDKSIVGDAGMFGCLAVDNIYNVMHQNDPIAYRLNACADPQYAASLKNAYVPSATTGFFETIGNAMKSMTPGVAAPADIAVGQMVKPTIVARLPSQLEMEVHNFTAEEKAEKKFFLLNENGQVDYFLSSGSGPLEIQYLNMLSAHSSYWTNPDFIRMMVTEVGRKPGRSHCLPNMKAVKIRHKS